MRNEKQNFFYNSGILIKIKIIWILTIILLSPSTSYQQYQAEWVSNKQPNKAKKGKKSIKESKIIFYL